MKQLDIFDWVKSLEKDSKRLVVNGLNTYDYRLLGYLKLNALGMEKTVCGNDLILVESLFLSSKEELRKSIKRLRKYQEVIIGSNSKGYWIALQDEQKEATQMLLNRLLSSIDTLTDIAPQYYNAIYSHLNQRVKKLDLATQGQLKIQFNGWETPTVNRFGNKYL